MLCVEIVRHANTFFFFICIYYFQPVFYRLGMSRGIYNVFSITSLLHMFFLNYSCCLILFCCI